MLRHRTALVHPTRRAALAAALLLSTLLLAPPPAGVRAAAPVEVRIDFATYNPVSLVLKEKGWLEQALAAEGVKVRWVQSLGSNKALEFLNASSLDFGSTAGAAALVAKVHGNPIKSIYVYSRPEWTALVTRKDTGIKQVSELKGKRVAVTRGTDPHIFLVRALAEVKLTEKDVKLVLLQHADGRLALDRGDVDAWAGLDPMMAQAEIESGDVLFFRKPEANTWGVLNVRDEFAKAHPALVRKVLSVYEQARKWTLAHPKETKAIFAAFTKLPGPVVDRQLDTRTDFKHNALGEPQRASILAAGLALKDAGVLPPATDVKATLDQLIDPSYLAQAIQ